MDEVESPEEAPTLEFAAGRTFSEGQVLGKRYRIRTLLGRGGMGEVWRAVDLKLRVDVALKALRIELLADERALETLRQEVRMAREVVSPNVCRVFDLVEIDGQELVSMEYIDGITLLDILKMRAPLDLTEAREIAAQFLAGLDAIHESGLVHRDVKPENLMMTRSGRMVLMDFGIAKGLAEGRTGTVAGTPAYMAPEQSRGEAPDARADVFSAGVVLAEMIAPSGLGLFEVRQAIWQGIHQESPVLPESPWAPVLRKAVARHPQQRYASASALARALEEVTLRVDRAEDVKPYPGLASFSQEDARYFFGRELEVEEMWKKLRRPQLYGLIGPSGAGKSSFLRAGLLPVTPTGWRTVVMTPGNQPFPNLARALVAEMSGDTEALQLLVDAENPESLSKVIGRWRQQHDQVVLMLDQFEELFTLNPPEVQERFAGLLARLALEGDAHVLLSMRDDFLFYCSAQSALSPMFSELTPLRAPSGTALRRAVVQPALKCGYRFEDESLVGEMVEEVSRERGALPMLAFAAARLWEHRDRERGLLTREAYEHIGGVAGALAQHAEQTLERIGQDQVPIVRELFRNLVTAQGTRVARTRDELLSVFGSTETAGTEAGRFNGQTDSKRPGSVPAGVDGGRETAEQVLDSLIDARLLTSYELPADNDEGAPQQQIEIIHESLLANWPRLVRWQTQDADSAQLRDQIRQVAQMWEEGGRPDDLLWTGTSYDEYQLWRERYSGGLSTAEESFTAAMTAHAERRKRRRRRAIAAVITALVIGLGIVGTFWRQAAVARDLARQETLRAEASQLLTLGRQEIEQDPNAALAYALAALERTDDPAARLFALDALWRGPTAFILPATPDSAPWGVDFSPDGNWLASTGFPPHVMLWSIAGGEPKVVEVSQKGMLRQIRFGPNSDVVTSLNYREKVAQLISVADAEVMRTLSLPSDGYPETRMVKQRNRLITFAQQGPLTEVTGVPLDGGPLEPYGDLNGDLAGYTNKNPRWVVEVDPQGTLLASVPFVESSPRDDLMRQVYVTPMNALPSASRRLVGRHREMIMSLAFHPEGDLLAAGEMLGEIRLWSLADETEVPRRIFHSQGGAYGLGFDPSGSKLAATSGGGEAFLWHLEGPPDADPLTLRWQGGGALEGAFHPTGHWFATDGEGVRLWPIARRYPMDLNGHEADIFDLAFLPDGSALASTSADGTLRLWPLSAAAGSGSQVLYDTGGIYLKGLSVGPRSERVMVGGGGQGVWLISVDGGGRQKLAGLEGRGAFALGPRGRLAASSASTPGRPIRVLDLETGDIQSLTAGVDLTVGKLRFTPDGLLISNTSKEGSLDGDLRIWNLEDGSHEVLSDKPGSFDLTPDGRFLLASRQGESSEPVLYDLANNTSMPLPSHGEARSVALDTEGQIAVTRRADGHGQVGLVTGGPPHLLVSSETFKSPVVSPDGQWIAAAHGSTIRLWPMPDMSQPPLHTLPLDQLLASLRALTNLRVVPDPESETGWGFELDLFPGWEKVPTW
jgi:WD40 repeat protein